MIQDYLKSGYPVLLVRTHEPERFIGAACQQAIGRKPYQWDVVRGFRQLGNGAEWQECDPFDLPNVAAKGTEKAVWFLRNFHFWLNEPPVIQAIQNNLPIYKTKGITLVIVSPDAKLPLELEREVVVLDFPLPTREELKTILAGLVESTGIEPEDEAAVLDAAQGLTWEEGENALALALVRQKRFDPHTICTLKAQMVEKSASLQFSQFTETFATLGGLENLKEWTLNRFKNRRPGLPFRGILLLGVPGTGKSHFAKALGNEVGWPVLSLDMGRVFGSLVGESEAKMREALKVVDAMAPAILFIDELEKGLAGVGGSSTDGGTTQRVGGTFLQWLNDHTSEVFVIATCNSYEKLPPEYTRMGRWDCLWFVDNPGPREQLDILDIYLKQFMGKTLGTIMAESDGRVKIPDLDGYSGAEIRQVVIEAAYNGGDLEAAVRFVIPISRSQKAQMDTLREWARARTIPASKAVGEEVRGKRRVQV
ncbi:MAG: AAA family ATPase [Deltaproteobacteria bacterium]|nr:AAA family ATPase [Deltaproteobacteria bacterium]